MGISKIEPGFNDYKGHFGLLIFIDSCNFDCPHCYNKDYINNHRNSVDISDVYKEMESGLYDAVILTGGECTTDEDTVLEITKYARFLNMKVKLFTNGSTKSGYKFLEDMINKKLIDMVSLDVKVRPNEKDFNKCRKVIGNLSDKEINEYLMFLRKTINLISLEDIDYELRLMTIPGVIDSDEVLEYFRESTGYRDNEEKIVFNKFKNKM